ncbi:hypothetical protein N8I77_010850 [Diaporthe amygdali]|uniref:Uncharacterized protein n=1 Tax=Phomopsis amygdali TaxID=1214568 RepID=A0AAD9S9D6_PHOAM|nr:hypothetical protein N8I77_010850 [Diaporthe amygdali]
MPPKQRPGRKPFEHDELVNFKITKDRTQSNVLEQVDLIQEHMEVAERNFDVILAAAVKVSKVFSNFNRITTFDLGSIINLVQDLRTIFRLLRSRLSRQFPGIIIRRQSAAPGEQIPERIRHNVYTCLCPLTVLLQIVAQCLSDLKVRVPQDVGNNAWGTIQPLYRLLVHMEKSLSTTTGVAEGQPAEHIGLALCIMLHERNSRYLVTSTAPRYGALKALDTYARSLRIGYMNRMRASLSEEARKRVQSLETYSESVKSERDATLRAKKQWNGAPTATLTTPETIMGHNAAFRTTGDYMTACLLDHLRFQFGRIETATSAEKAQRPDKRAVSGTTSCAEWELYITLLHSPDPDRPHASQCVAVTYGIPKAKTWETNKVNQRPPTTTHHPPNPTPLPKLPRPTAQRVGIDKSSTFANYSQPTHHPAAGQYITKMQTPPQRPYPQANHAQTPRPAHYQNPPQPKKKKKSRGCCF